MSMRIPFNKPFMSGKELWYITEAHARGHLSGDGLFTARCSEWLEQQTGTHKALITHSCTGALEMAAILADIKPGDEVIMPSFTFTSTANAFALRGATPVFVDIRPDTLNMDEKLIEEAITERTRAIVPVHYAGVACEMDTINEIAFKHDLMVIEDAAQGLRATYKTRALGTIGTMGTVSFHETKNIISGEGGALLLSSKKLADRAEIIREKGTNRKAYFRGEVDKYSWVDIGSSFLPSDMIAAFLWAQMEESDLITRRRIVLWNTYHEGLRTLADAGLLRRPVIPEECEHNAHMYFIVLPSPEIRDKLVNHLSAREIHAVFHYIPLHDSVMGRKIGRVSGDMTHTKNISRCVLRLPFWLGIEAYQEEVIAEVRQALIKPVY